jgi:hypothetical protein
MVQVSNSEEILGAHWRRPFQWVTQRLWSCCAAVVYFRNAMILAFLSVLTEISLLISRILMQVLWFSLHRIRLKFSAFLKLMSASESLCFKRSLIAVYFVTFCWSLFIQSEATAGSPRTIGWKSHTVTPSTFLFKGKRRTGGGAPLLLGRKIGQMSQIRSRDFLARRVARFWDSNSGRLLKRACSGELLRLAQTDAQVQKRKGIWRPRISRKNMAAFAPQDPLHIWY